MMKNFLFSLSVLWCMAIQGQDNIPFLSKNFSSGSFQSAHVRTSGGNIEVSVIDAEPRVEIYIRSSNGKDELSKEEIQKRLDEMYVLEVGVNNNQLRAIARQKPGIRFGRKSLSISFKLYVPKKMATELRTSGGNLILTGLSGDQDLTTSGGNIQIDAVSGKIRGRTSGGNVHVQNAGDDLDLATSGGNIEAGNCKGKIRLSTSGGSIALKELEGNIVANTSGGNVLGKHISGELKASTSGGNVQLKDIAGSVEAGTSGGNVFASVRELGKYVTLTTSSGTVELELPAGKGLDLNLKGNSISTGKLQNFSGKVEQNEINGELNGGGVPVKIRSSGGRIVMTWK